MMLLAWGVNYRTAPVELRECLAFDAKKTTVALQELTSRYGCEAVVLSTCNRVEMYVGRAWAEVPIDAALITEFVAECQGTALEKLQPAVYSHTEAGAVHHLFRVVSGLDSLVMGEAQIAGQVQDAYALAREAGSMGPLLHSLFQHARRVSKRVRSETGIAEGKVSVSSLAVDYITQVFDHFHDKTMLVIGAGKMGELTLRHLSRFKPKQILVTNRSPEKAREVAETCGGEPVPFERLDDGLARADIVLSTTGATEPIVTLERFQRIMPHRDGRHVAIIDIAVPRDFDPRIGKLELVDLLVNIDDLQSIRERVLRTRQKHLPAAETIVQAECDRFLREWARRGTGPAIARLHQDWDIIRRQVQAECFRKLNGKLSDADQAVIEGAFKLLQNKFLHGPISALREEAQAESAGGLLEAIYKLFGLREK